MLHFAIQGTIVLGCIGAFVTLFTTFLILADNATRKEGQDGP